MRLEIAVRKFFDRELRHKSQVQEGEVAVPSHFGEDLVHVQVERDEPNVVQVHIPDSDIDRMVEDHREGARVAAAGYTAIHEGGPMHGQEVTVAPRSVPTKSRNRLIAEHLSGTVLPSHASSEHIGRVKILDGYRNSDGDEEDAASTRKLEKFLTAHLSEDPDDEPHVSRHHKAEAAPEEDDQ